MNRARRTAPSIEGFTLLKPLGTGGFADVYLYQQALPSRQVAVKVLHAGVSANTAAAFTAEANAMAQLSTHPSIVTIFGAAIAGDGRPYLVMEYYPGPNLSVRSKQRPLAVADALDVMIRVSGAVETAHRNGIIHRDIKPANILTSAYGKPGLTDFGIASAKTDLAERDSGLSIPWCPPQIIEETSNGDEVSDVYSLAATLYTLLAGHSPFEIPGQRNGMVDIMARITAGSPTPLERSDLPVGLKRVIRMALDRDPANRPQTAAEFARLLQEVEVQLHLAVTPLDVLDESAAPELPHEDDDDGATRVRGATVVRPSRSAAAPHGRRGAVQAQPHRSSITGPGRLAPTLPGPRPGSPQAVETFSAVEASGDTGPVANGAHASKRSPVATGLALAGVAAAAGVAAVVLLGGGGDSTGSPTSEPTFDQDAIVLSVPAPTDLAIARTSETTATATWAVADPQPGDYFWWQMTGADGSPREGSTEDTTLLIESLAPSDPACLNVWLVRGARKSDLAAYECSEG